MTSSITYFKKAIGKFLPYNTAVQQKTITYDPAPNPPVNMITTVGAKAVRQPDTNIVDTVNKTWDFYNTFPKEFYEGINLNFHPNPSKITSKANVVLEDDWTFKVENPQRMQRSTSPWDSFPNLNYFEKGLIVVGILAWLYYFFKK